MREYRIKTVDKKDFSLAETADIDTFRWCGGGWEPRSFAKVVFVKNEGFYVQLTSYETDPLAKYRNYCDPVCEDSCLEFFFNLAPEKGVYVNFEANSAGTCLVGVGASRRGRTTADRITGNIPTAEGNIYGDRWTVEYFLPLEDLKKIFGDINTEKGAEYRGNFYKCGDKTEVEHYGMWSRVGTVEPDFHRPEYFGKFILD